MAEVTVDEMVFFTTVLVVLLIAVAATLDDGPPPTFAAEIGVALFVSVVISTIPPSLVVS